MPRAVILPGDPVRQLLADCRLSRGLKALITP